MKSLSHKVGIILLCICLFVFGGYLETFGAEWTYFYENRSTYNYFDQHNTGYTSKNNVRGWIKSDYKKKFIIEMGARLGHFKRFSKSEDPKLILLIPIVVWGIAIIFVLGVILYRLAIRPFIKKMKVTEQ